MPANIRTIRDVRTTLASRSYVQVGSISNTRHDDSWQGIHDSTSSYDADFRNNILEDCLVASEDTERGPLRYCEISIIWMGLNASIPGTRRHTLDGTRCFSRSCAWFGKDQVLPSSLNTHRMVMNSIDLLTIVISQQKTQGNDSQSASKSCLVVEINRRLKQKDF
jgi:hypothetical protein